MFSRLVTLTCRYGLTVPIVALMALSASACGREEPVGPAPDTTGPLVQIKFPAAPDVYDEDGDGLVDVRLTYHDSAGAVDVAHVTVRSLRGVDGPAGTGDLLAVWDVEQQDDSSLAVHETVANLLPSEGNLLVVAVPDTAGNVTEDTIAVTLPYGFLHTTIETGLPGWLPAAGVTICPDDGRLYMTVLDHLVVVDPDSLTILAIVEGGFEQLQALCVRDDPYLYVTDYDVLRFDRTTQQFMAPVEPSYAAYGIVQSRLDPNLLYVGESITGVIGIIDRAAGAHVGYLLSFTPYDEGIQDLAVLANDAKLYVPRGTETGILVVDPVGDSVLGRIRIGGETWPDDGVTRSIALSGDDRWLYAAVQDGDPRSVVQISTATDSVVRRLDLWAYVPGALALSPDESRMFVTTSDRFEDFPSRNVLIDVQRWEVLQEFARPRPPGELRWDLDVTFHPNGKLIFVTHNRDLDVYLNRR
jgi:DNA-binding beta-propeller fold protein YncE